MLRIGILNVELNSGMAISPMHVCLHPLQTSDKCGFRFQGCNLCNDLPVLIFVKWFKENSFSILFLNNVYILKFLSFYFYRIQQQI